MARFFRLSMLLFLLSGPIFYCGCKKKSPQPPKEPTDANPSSQKTTVPGGKIEMDIYYAGHPGSKREKDFVDFLNKHFVKTQTGDLAAFDGSQSEGFDVTILDYDGDGFESPRPRIPNTFTRPLMTLGVTGAFISGQRNLKTDYL